MGISRPSDLRPPPASPAYHKSYERYIHIRLIAGATQRSVIQTSSATIINIITIATIAAILVRIGLYTSLSVAYCAHDTRHQPHSLGLLCVW
jgi:hypothetical protein